MNTNFSDGRALSLTAHALALSLLTASAFATASYVVGNMADASNPVMAYIYAGIFVVLEIFAWFLWKGSYRAKARGHLLLAVISFACATGWEVYSGTVHYNYFYSSIMQGRVNASVESGVGEQFRLEKKERLMAELKSLDTPIVPPDYGLSDITRSIEAAQKDASISASKGSTTNARLLHEVTIPNLMEKRVELETKRIEFISSAEQQRSLRQAAIRLELDEISADQVAASKVDGNQKSSSESEVHYFALAAAIFIKLFAMLGAILSSVFAERRFSASPETPAAASTAVELPPAPAERAEDIPVPMAAVTPKTESPIRAVACAPASVKALDPLIGVEPEPEQVNQDSVAVADEEEATPAAEEVDFSIVRADDLDAFSSMEQMISEHPFGRPFPRKDFPNLLKAMIGEDRGKCGGSKATRLFQNAVARGLLVKEGSAYYRVVKGRQMNEFDDMPEAQSA